MKLRNTIGNKSFQFWAFYAGLFALSFLIFFWRFPDAFFQANFYAEDATFSLKIIDKQFFGALFERFNGYYIFGLYILTGISIFFNKIIFANFLSLPKSIALVSYAFLAFSSTLPALLFSDRLKKINLAILTVFSSFVPLIGWDYAVIGGIGNLKFLFSYIAFLFILYRLLLPEESRRFYIADFAIFICAYTNPAVYLLVPAIYSRYLKDFFVRKIEKKEMIKDKSFVSALVLAAVLVVQFVIVKTQGVPKLEGYLDGPFDYQKTIEIFLARPYLYALFYNFFGRFSDLWILFLSGFAVFFAWRYGKKKRVYLFSLYSIFAVTLIFVATRPGIHVFFNHYELPSGPSQFFYAQNLIFYFLFVWFLQDISDIMSKKRKMLTYIFTVGFLALSFPQSGSFGKNNFMLKTGTFEENTKKACADASEKQERITVGIYPEEKIVEKFPAKLICH